MDLTAESTINKVHNFFAFNFIAASSDGRELKYLDDVKIDVDIGTDNDFELVVPLETWSEEVYGYGNLIYVSDTEYGGIIEDIESKTNGSSGEVVLRGHTWRGLLTQKIVESSNYADSLLLNGELNTVIANLVGDRFGEFFTVSKENTGIVLKNWPVQRYAALYDTIMKFLDFYGYRLQIEYREGEGVEAGKVFLQAVPVKDYSGQLEYSQDYNLSFNIRDCRTGINHLICIGGEKTEQAVIHLYVQADGSIGETQYYKGLAERTTVHDCGNTKEEAELEEKGTEKLKELQNYKKFSMNVDNIDLEIGDIVGGREQITGMELKKPVVGKIFRKSDGKISIEYKLKGED